MSVTTSVGHRLSIGGSRRLGSPLRRALCFIRVAPPEWLVCDANHAINEVRSDQIGGHNAGKTLLVETHSEHIMLRLLRRIRETTENQVPPGLISLSPEDLSVIYVESSDDGVRFRPLRVDHDGEFIDRWPKGFFEERAEELF
jgi:Protein of unknown function (DUF3696)